MTTLEDRGNAVKINNTLIPAINIQVENVPGWVKCDIPQCRKETHSHWFGIYFEVMFEDGALWEVSYKVEEDADKRVYVYAYPTWGMCDTYHEALHNTEAFSFPNWDDFVLYYSIARERPIPTTGYFATL